MGFTGEAGRLGLVAMEGQGKEKVFLYWSRDFLFFFWGEGSKHDKRTKQS